MSKSEFHNSEYWEERIANETWKTYNSAEEKNRALLDMYNKTSNAIKKEFYALAEEAEANGGLTRTQQYRFNKLLGQQGFIYQEIEKLGEKVNKHGTSQMYDAGMNVYENIMKEVGIGEFSLPNKKQMEQMMRSPWHGSFFSERLWKDMGKLQSNLNGIINDGVATGKTVTEMAIQLSNIMNKDFNYAHNLVRTETINYMNRSALKGYKDAGIKKVQWWAAEDERMCETCGANHSKPYDIDKTPNLPCHPGCRCTWLPVIDTTLNNSVLDENNDNDSKVKKVHDLRKVISNNSTIVNTYFSKLDVSIENVGLIEYIKNDISLIPINDLEILNKHKLIVRESKDKNSHHRSSKKFINILFDLTNQIDIAYHEGKQEGSFAHEFAHFIADKTEIYKNKEFITVIENSVKNAKLKVVKLEEKEFMYVDSPKFVKQYQGRTYITFPEFINNGEKIAYDDLKEFVSVGYQTYVTNPELLYSKDKMLYDFFEEGLFREK